MLSKASARFRGSNLVFVDSSYWVALVDDRDKWHPHAVRIRPRISASVSVVDLAAAEALTIVGSRLGGKSARSLYQVFLDSCRLVFTDADALDVAMTRHLTHDGRLSVTDCATVEAMIASTDLSIVSFDSDFDAIKGIARLH